MASKKDYDAIAQILNDITHIDIPKIRGCNRKHQVLARLEVRLSEYFHKDNPNFDATRWSDRVYFGKDTKPR